MKYLILILGLFIAFDANAVEFKIGDKAKYNISIATTEDELQRGLMFVRSLPDDGGMLFDLQRFRGKGVGMWMKNTYIPLDMLFINCDFEVVDIYKNAKPMSLETIKSAKDYCYVLEINGGQAEANEIKVGDKVLYPSQK